MNTIYNNNDVMYSCVNQTLSIHGTRFDAQALQVCRNPGGKILALQPLPHLAAAKSDNTWSVTRDGRNCVALRRSSVFVGTGRWVGRGGGGVTKRKEAFYLVSRTNR